MAILRFLPQTTLDGWLDAGTVDLRSGMLVEMADNAEFPVREAVHFVKLESGEDEAALMGKVKALDSLKAVGAEHCMTSVIVGETVYEVVPGWVAEEPVTAGAARPVSKKFEGKNPEADMLAKLLLDKLS
jgi:hypothetical protein